MLIFLAWSESLQRSGEKLRDLMLRSQRHCTCPALTHGIPALTGSPCLFLAGNRLVEQGNLVVALEICCEKMFRRGPATLQTK